ncbi:glutaredoxin family protein [Sporosarcina sp. G11-34]|uniref:glutaredoxin family protein n=1 Tax=Sporosarcina sp. G11-34 TaxID=2849605 RepID=UPI0022A94ECA|nr:glutaredoxin family protein [Sporosarcina sp. G11-34]MCZ2260156.1 glutaredoxin family protein [Sporosarcina sp. G11-34]
MSKELSVVVWSKEGCSYCEEVKEYLTEQNIAYQTVDVTNHDEFRDILDVKYGIRHVPVVEIGKGEVYKGVTEVGLEHVKAVLEKEYA